jgi:hypothetical protein
MSKKKPTLKETSIEEIIPDDKNMNKGSLDGQALINHSIRKLGTGRSILIDKNNRTIDNSRN